MANGILHLQGNLFSFLPVWKIDADASSNITTSSHLSILHDILDKVNWKATYIAQKFQLSI